MMAAANHTMIDCHHVWGFHSVTGLMVASDIAEQRESGDERQQMQRM